MTLKEMTPIASLVVASILSAPSLLAEESKEADRVEKSVEVLESILAAPDKSVPADLLAEAHAVAVIPNMVKGAFFVGGRYGKGVVAARTEVGEWGTPCFIEIEGGSFGLQLGVEATDLILVFTEPDGLREMLKDNLKLGVGAAAVAGPVGRHVEAGSNFTFDSPIYAYSRNKGVFAGVAVDGSVLSVDDSANHDVYGDGITGTDIVIKGEVEPNEVTRPFVDALAAHVPASTD